jgi:predicted pyridoxine 5'-phosphate oxidase superfamily flavin-nucleotide-binding protein
MARLTSAESSMRGLFHSGELEVQERAGVRHQAAKIGSGIHAEISAPYAEFLRARRWVVAAGLAPDGSLWASAISGETGFLDAIEAGRLRVAARPIDGDPVAAALRDGADVGLVAIDLAHRRRVRVNGRVEVRDGGFDVVTREVFGNCPRFIQARVAGESPAERAPVDSRESRSLDAAARAWIAGADTFFIATRSDEAGADASHRGGEPGFVEAVDGARLFWGDYSGNRMFQTLGNLATDPRAGLLFIDFDAGRTLQLSGRAKVDWDADRAARVAGAERVVDFTVERVVETAGRAELRAILVERSPHNPRTA